ncbi:DeoR/GlpR family DNA-binding transcription regulator [Streptococcus parasanguinis]|uniref:DeoR/GlpR family DNA-binding transcription regulator n=1 Tax=Streptococcus parasanguinis TaxID=1318 RepID=UPI001CBB58B2|nr:DeoR/GlpR family DNA-binding transcription regulator [Streptococcus parasanguinis]MBZ2079265.1 DeoR/GlpR family DNA-binding transcription regulator [Streptococcus parasanguinis]
MYQEQRLEKILELLEERKQLSAKEMVDYFKVSKDTIRRDFALLSQRQLVRRTHGGLLPLNKEPGPSYLDRSQKANKEKTAMAQKALQWIQNGQVIFLDASTSITLLAGLLDGDLTVYSHSLDNAIQLSSHSQVDFHLLGGKFYPKNRFYYAADQAQILDNLRFDLAFFGASSLANGEVTFEDAEDVAVKSLVFERTRTKVLVAESAKFHQHANYYLARLQQFDYWITDKKPSPDILKQIGSETTILY